MTGTIIDPSQPWSVAAALAAVRRKLGQVRRPVEISLCDAAAQLIAERSPPLRQDILTRRGNDSDQAVLRTLRHARRTVDGESQCPTTRHRPRSPRLRRQWSGPAIPDTRTEPEAV